MLDQAIPVFRAQGYAGTSIGDISEATDLTVGSLYKAFKDKRALFQAVFDRYTSLRQQAVAEVAERGARGRERLRDVLGYYVRSSTDKEGRLGCLVVASAIELAATDADVQAKVTAALTANERFLARLIRDGQSDRSLRPDIDADDTARVLVCLTQGMRVVGRAGHSPPDADTAVAIAMRLVD